MKAISCQDRFRIGFYPTPSHPPPPQYCSIDQREGMGLLEYQAMPSLRDVAHDSGCVHLLYNSSIKIHQLAARQLLSGQPVRYGKGGRSRPVHHVQNHTCRVTLLQPARRAAVLGQPSSLWPHWYRPSKLNPTDQKKNQDGYRTGFLTFFQLGAWII